MSPEGDSSGRVKTDTSLLSERTEFERRSTWPSPHHDGRRAFDGSPPAPSSTEQIPATAAQETRLRRGADRPDAGVKAHRHGEGLRREGRKEGRKESSAFHFDCQGESLESAGRGGWEGNENSNAVEGKLDLHGP